MHPNTATRLWDQAEARRLAALPQVGPEVTTKCLQCNAPTTDSFTYAGHTSYWCESDWDFWWLTCTVPQMYLSGQIAHISEALVWPDVNEQLLGWPD